MIGQPFGPGGRGDDLLRLRCLTSKKAMLTTPASVGSGGSADDNMALVSVARRSLGGVVYILCPRLSGAGRAHSFFGVCGAEVLRTGYAVMRLSTGRVIWIGSDKGRGGRAPIAVQRSVRFEITPHYTYSA